MISEETTKAIETIRRMDLKVAVPHKYTDCGFVRNDCTTTTVATKTIHIPSIFTDYEREIRCLQQQVWDVKRAVELLFGKGVLPTTDSKVEEGK
jgi:hypothetical protein